MEDNFKNAFEFAQKGYFQKCINESESLSIEKFLDLALILKDNSFSKFEFWFFLTNSKHFIQFINHPYSYIYLAKLFKNQPNDPGASDLILFFAENQPKVLIKAIRVSKAFLDNEWHSIFEKQLQHHPNKYLRVHFQCFTKLRRIDSDQWHQVEEKSSCLKSFENSPIELLNELAIWYDLNPDSYIPAKTGIVVNVLNIATEFLIKNKFLLIGHSITEKEFNEANLKTWKRVESFEKHKGISPVFNWLNKIMTWRETIHKLLQQYCFDLNYEPLISNEGIISLIPGNVEKIKVWENNGRKIKLMFNDYDEIAKTIFSEARKRGEIQDQTDKSISQSEADFFDIKRIATEIAWLNTFNNENLTINKKESGFQYVSRFFGEYSGNCLIRWNKQLTEKYITSPSQRLWAKDILDPDFIMENMYKHIYITWLRHDSFDRLVKNINQYGNNIDSESILNLLVYNAESKDICSSFNRYRVKTNLCSTPFLKFGDNLFVFTSIIANTRPYAFLFDNLLNQNKKNVFINDLSSKFEDRISKLFISAGFSTNFGNDKKFLNEDTGEHGDLDALAYKNGYLFVIEAKLAALRITLEDAQNELSTTFLKGASQLNKALKFIEYDFRKTESDQVNTKSSLTNIKEKLGIKEESFRDLKICPLIVSTSFESDHERIGWGDNSFLKISWHELMLILSEESNPQKIVERIETNEFWKFLEVMPTPSITEKSIPVASLSEPEHPNSAEIFNLANASYKNGKYKEAIIAINQAIEKDENNSDYYVLLGDCYAKIKDLEAAAKSYKNAIELDPYYFKGFKAFGSFCFENDHLEFSYQFLKKALELNPLDKSTKELFLRTSVNIVEQKILKEHQVNLDWDNIERRINHINQIEFERKFS